jgi:FlaA1/EpsC-like NDP-sugar epimerase
MTNLFMNRRLHRACTDFVLGCAIAVSLTLAFLLRFEYRIPSQETSHLWQGLLLALGVKLGCFRMVAMDRTSWRYVGVTDLYDLAAGNGVASLLWSLAVLVVVGATFPCSVFAIDLLLCFLLTAGLRLTARLWFERHSSKAPQGERKRILIYGAGSAGVTLLKEIQNNPSLGYQVLGFLDDDRLKIGKRILGAPVLGNGRSASAIVERLRRRRTVDEIVIAMPSASGRAMNEAISNCRAAGVSCKTIPGMAELLSGRILTRQIRNVSVEDLLGREPVRLDETLIRDSIEGRSVLITGGGGSIGSELCRQVATFRPERLVVFERGETDLFRIHRELTDRYPRLKIIPVIGDIREPATVQRVIRRNTIDSIFHAAAYKHVPVMELHLLEAVKNNILGTHNMVHAARQSQVRNFLMISSDKAVNPTNVMGLTKRVAELIVSSIPPPVNANSIKTVSVRFGNVLGSNGSVVPLFKQQIAAGGPVTVTHPDMRRYFMTIREAVQLVLQASTMGKGSEIFVLDMGEPVQIVTLARNMIRLSGHEPDVDIEIRFTGLRPGEKLFEEIALEDESHMPTYHEKIRIFRGSGKTEEFMKLWLAELQELVDLEQESGVLIHLKGLVPEYQPMGRWREMLGEASDPMNATVAS